MLLILFIFRLAAILPDNVGLIVTAAQQTSGKGTLWVKFLPFQTGGPEILIFFRPLRERLGQSTGMCHVLLSAHYSSFLDVGPRSDIYTAFSGHRMCFGRAEHLRLRGEGTLRYVFDWLIDWSAGFLPDYMLDRFFDCLIDWLVRSMGEYPLKRKRSYSCFFTPF